MGEVPREVLSTTLRVRLTPEVAQRAVEGLLEYIRRNEIFPAQKVAENVYLLDIPIRGFLRTTREKLILAKNISVARGGTRVISFNDVDNKLVLTVTISPETGGTRIHVSCSSLSKLRKACNRLAEILSDVLATAEMAAPPPTPAPAPVTAPPTPPRAEEERKPVPVEPRLPETGLTTVAERGGELTVTGEEKTLELGEREAPRELREAVGAVEARPREEEKPAIPAAPATPVTAPAPTPAPPEPRPSTAAPFNITTKYSEYVDETGLVMLILRGDLVHRTNVAPGTPVDTIIEKIKRVSKDNPGRVIVATLSSRESPDMVAIALDSDGNATLSIKEDNKEARITDSYEEFIEFASKLLEKPSRLVVYRLR